VSAFTCTDLDDAAYTCFAAFLMIWIIEMVPTKYFVAAIAESRSCYYRLGTFDYLTRELKEESHFVSLLSYLSRTRVCMHLFQKERSI
jgi:hypothetical protein